MLGINKKKLRLADAATVKRSTGCIPGAVPPFGSIFEGVSTYVDNSLKEQGDTINFNAVRDWCVVVSDLSQGPSHKIIQYFSG